MYILLHMTKELKDSDRVLELAQKRGIIRGQDLKEHGIHPEHLRRLVKRGILVRIGRGMYVLAGADLSVHHTLSQVAKWIPNGVICLLSALQFHDIGTHAPYEVWVALDRRFAHPRIDYPPLRIMRFSGKALSEGVEEYRIESVPVKVYNTSKTVADCFKYRNKIGLDVAIEALRDCRSQRKCTNDDLWRYAKICRVWNVMKPYLEALS